MKSFFFLLFLLIPSLLLSQSNAAIKQLIQSLDTITNQTNKVSTYIDIAWEYMIVENDSSLYYSNIAKDFAQKNNYKFGEVISLEMEGIYYESVENKFDKAIEAYLEAIRIAEENEINYLDSLHLSLGILFQQTKDYKKADDYYQMALKEARKNKHLDVVKIALINLGVTQSKLKKYDLALKSLHESLNYPAQDQISNDETYSNIGQIKMQQGLHEEAVSFLEKSVSGSNIKNDIRYSILFAKLIENKIILNDSNGIDTLIPIIENYFRNTETINEKLPLSIILSKVYEYQNKFQQALKYKNAQILFTDSINKLSRDDLIYDYETKYQTQRTKDELVKKDQQRKFYLYLSLLGLIIAALLGFFFFKNRKKNILLAKQKKMLEVTIDEKNVLLKETHHRVKNSFQIVSSLLYLQSENITDKEAQLAIKEAQNRVRSMVLIHQKLYSKDQLVGIDTKEYFTDLVKDIIESHQFKENPLSYYLEVDSMILNIETITPLGLILNEMIVNVLKHAFEKIDETSKMNITFKKEGETLLLQVKDNGKGLVDVVKDTSFGIKLIKALARKLKANFTVKTVSEGGTIASLEVSRFEVL